MSHSDLLKFKEICKQVRVDILDMAYNTKTAHIGPSYSIVELLVMLYFDAMNINPDNVNHPHRDYFILSKGHAALTLYSVLAHKKFFPKEFLKEYHVDGGKFHGHVCRDAAPGIEISSGSLGHGLPIAAGIAQAKKKQSSPSKIYVLLGDGECNEGSIWEAAMYTAHHKLENLTAIIDYNKYQGFGHSHEVTALHPLIDKWRSFGWAVLEIDGHDLEKIKQAYDKLPFSANKPTAIIAHTISGKGMSHIENTLDAHYYKPEEDVYNITIKDLNAQ